MNKITQKILACFSNAAGDYHGAAQVQKRAIAKLELPELPKGKILELGCGTGILSERLLANYRDHEFLLTDISKEMLAQAEKNLGDCGAAFGLCDIEELADVEQYEAVFSTFALQWVQDLEASLNAMMKSLKSGGKLVAIIQGDGSYPEWKAACAKLKLDYLANQTPRKSAIESLVTGHSFQVETLNIATAYPSAMAFFKELKVIGAATNLQNKSLDFKEFKSLLAELDQAQVLTMTTEVLIVTATKA